METHSIYRDRSFWGLAVSQFLGAFNDNLFKQLVLLLCLDYSSAEVLAGGETSPTDRYQPIAMGMFALPWILFSGIAGLLSDRSSKQRGILLFKAVEIVVMACGLFAFLSGELAALMLVLFLMSTQSTFFGPSKYGILPELFQARDLPQINGVFQMTTFVTIIFGFTAAGLLKTVLPGQEGLAIVSAIAIGIAVLGTLAATLIRRTEPAQPSAQFSWANAGIDRENWRLLRADRFLLGVLLASSVFWFVGGVVQPAVNNFGRRDLVLSDARTSLLQACVGIGIAGGCLLAGRFSRQRIRFGLVRAGAVGLTISLALLAVLAHFGPSRGAAVAVEPFGDVFLRASTVEWLTRLSLLMLGVSAGVFVVPLQVVLQSAPPAAQKGRMIGTMNFVNWVGILLSAVFYKVLESSREALTSSGLPLRPGAVFAALAVVIAVLAIAWRPADRELS